MGGSKLEGMSGEKQFNYINAGFRENETSSYEWIRLGTLVKFSFEKKKGKKRKEEKRGVKKKKKGRSIGNTLER